jgi:hypothetical protein
MQTKTLLVGSVVINLALFAALGFRSKPAPIPKNDASVEATAVETKRAVAGEKVRKPVVISEREAFQWNQIETPDFQQYIANLRAIGCPEETIRDLIIAEVNKLYAPKFSALMAQTHQFAYWKPGSKKSREELQKQLEALRVEKKVLIKTLLGIDADPYEQWAKITADELVEQGKFGFLSAEKQKLVRDILAKYKQLEGSSRMMDEGMIMGGSETKKLREQRRQELAQALSPEELYQFDLRDSNASESVRGRFGAASLTEDEYKKLFDLRKAYEDDVGAVADNSDPEKMRQRNERRKLLEEAYNEALGPDRAKEIAREQDPQWRALSRVAEQHSLDPQTVQRAYEFQQVASEQVAKIFSDGSVPRENRSAVVDQINAELRRNLVGLMGEQVYNDYSKAGPQFYFSSGGDTISISGLGSKPAVAAPGATIFRSKAVTK